MSLRFAALILFACTLLSTPVWSGPAAPIELEITQPDGTSFIAVPRGDEFANWVETPSGHSIVKKNDTWFYAEKDSAGNLRASDNAVGSLSPDQLQALPKHLAPAVDPSVYDRGKIRKVSHPARTGETNLDQPQGVLAQNVLTILVDYLDVSFTYTDASFESLMFGATSSVKEFFEENSYGNFTVVPAAESYGVANDGIVHVARGINHPDLGLGNWRSEASDIVALADASVNFAAFDTSGEGTVSADELSIVIILAGYEASYGGAAFANTPNVWGHASGFPTLILDGVGLSPYTMFGETHGLTSAPADDHQATIGIMCHELGHLMFDLPDLYDIDQSSAGIGDWGLMAGGSWNFAPGNTWIGESPAHMVAWSKTQVGFTAADVVESFQAGAMFPNAGANAAARMMWIDKYRTANGEFILFENRQMTGYDAGLPGAGLMIWHIDQGVRSNANEMRKLVDLEEADGLAELDANINGGDAGD
ncbi:MAG: M6 family metalloprotease domain-containing protein, partial [Xanthomonadales bacterium]|nr:M6 family metalloprotease domain-containing protein [Xanthomonadales bacterium]